MSAITRFLPKNHLSYVVGILVHIKLPRIIGKWVIYGFAKWYSINLEEAELSFDQYPSLGDFFVRKLKKGIRPIGQSWAVHPADSVITQASPIVEGELIQAKGQNYSLADFTQDDQSVKHYNDGYFLTYYLCPTDYHRVHSPVTGKIKRAIHIPGALWPVNTWSTQNIHKLFSVNERVLVEIETEKGFVTVVFVGATNVGKIVLSFDQEVIGNQLLSSAKLVKNYQDISIQKGDELGMFRMGSTVVMLYSKNQLENVKLDQLINKQVKVNSEL